MGDRYIVCAKARYPTMGYSASGSNLAILVISMLALCSIPAGAETLRQCRISDHSEVQISGGVFAMGSGRFHAEEHPVRRVVVPPFWIDRFDVTNADFSKFVADTGYVTDAERAPNPADFPEVPSHRLVPGGSVFFEPSMQTSSAESAPAGWRFVPGANWRHPYGPQSTIVGRDNYPVVQVSYRDALAYACWAGRELPTEEQYEYAARGGLEGKTYAWGNSLTPRDKWLANTWQGEFPTQNDIEDGFAGIAPVGCFPPNGYGLYDMSGNVWKWTSTPYTATSTSAIPASRVMHTIKGGSFMCSSTYCQGFRPSARQSQESSFSSMHLGFRTVKNIAATPGAQKKCRDRDLDADASHDRRM